MVHQPLPCSREASRVSASEAKAPASRLERSSAVMSIGAEAPSEVACQAAARNSSLVAAKSWARVRTFSDSTTTASEPSGSSENTGTICSTSIGVRDSMPSTAWCWLIFSNMSAACGMVLIRSLARAAISSVISSSRQGTACTVVGGSSESIES